MPKAGLVVSFLKSQNPKFKNRAFKSSTFSHVAVDASYRHGPPICRLLGLSPVLMGFKHPELESKCDPGANVHVWLKKDKS